jgi:hypothetical protein
MKILPVLLAAFVLGLPACGQTLINYQSTVLAQSPSAYFHLDGTFADATGNNPPMDVYVGTGGFMPDAYRNASNSYSFLGQTDALTNVNDLISGGGVTTNSAATNAGSFTLLFRTLDGLSTGGQRYLLGQGNTTTTGNALGVFFENGTASSDTCALKLRIGDGTTTLLLSNNIVFGAWYYLAVTYDEARDAGEVNWYLGRIGNALNSGTIDMSNDAVVGNDDPFVLGNQTNLNSGFRNPGKGRIDEFAVWNRELTGTEISDQFAKLPNPFPANVTYQQLIQAQGPKYYFKLDGSLVESVGNILTLSSNGAGGSFTSDFLGNPARAYSFSETNDALYVTNDLVNGGGPTINTAANGVGTLSFLFRMLSDTNNSGQRFLFSAPGSEATSTDDDQLGLFLESSTPSSGENANSLKLRVGNTTKGNVGSSDPVPVAYAEDLVPNAWYYFAMTYDESRNTPEVFVYFGRVGGTLTNSSFNPANSSVVGDNGWLVLGNKIQTNGITGNAFQNPGEGAIDDFAIWHDELAADEIAAQFAALSPALSPAPSLTIELLSTEVLLHWPATTSTEYVLESATNLTSSPWTGAGAPVVVGSDFVVTNVLATGEKYFRLHRQ